MLMINALTWTVALVHWPRWTANHELPTWAMFFAVLNALALAIRLGGDRSVSSRARAFTGVAGDELSEGWTSSNDSPSISLPVQGSAASTLEFALVACGTGIWRQHKRGSIFSGSYFVVKPSASKSTRSIC
jgi:hypothetical protein